MTVENGLKWISFMILLAFSSCTGTEQENDVKEESIKSEKEGVANIPEAGSLSGDTINLSGKYVLFFGPSSGPAQEQAESREFRVISETLIDSVNSIGNIKTLYSEVGHFRIYSADGSSMIISKSALRTTVGVLMTDGHQPPSIKKGPVPAAEYLGKIKEYFFLQ